MKDAERIERAVSRLSRLTTEWQREKQRREARKNNRLWLQARMAGMRTKPNNQP